MTDYELADIFVTHAQVLLTYFMGFISATSALLVVAHVTGSTLPAALVRVVIAIYTITSVFLIASFQRLSAVVLGIRGQMGESLNWHAVVHEDPRILELLTSIGVFAMVVIYVSGIWYLLRVRRLMGTE
ncbi:MAG: hypothetical protein O3C28_02020 [Proteobacteria bacterium]|nr:hypothetical protein [Pseudomonadota bacterium]